MLHEIRTLMWLVSVTETVLAVRYKLWPKK